MLTLSNISSLARAVAAAVMLAFVLSSCTVTKQMASPQQVAPTVTTKAREKALDHFMQGGVYDINQQYASAASEYEEAIQYDPTEPAIYFALAKDYKQLDKMASAIYNARKAIEIDTTNEWYYDLLGQLYYFTADYDRAAFQYNQMLRINPANVNALYTLSNIYTVSKQIDKAIQTYDRITNLIGPEFEVLSQKFLLQTEIGKSDESLFTLQQMIMVDPENIDLRRLQGETFMRLGRYESAEAVYNYLILKNPDDIKSIVALTEIDVRKKDWPAFETTINKLFANDSLNAEDKIKIGEFYLERLRTDTVLIKPSLIIFEKLRREYPKKWQPYWYLSAIYMDNKDFDSAIESLKKVTEFEPKFVPAWDNLAVAYFNKNEFEKMIESLKDGRKKIAKPEYRLELLLGFALNRVGRDAECIDVLEGAFKLNPNDQASIDLLSTLGITYERLKRYVDADRTYEAALKIDPDNALILNNYAYSLIERDQQKERCLVMAKRAVEKEPENSSYLDTIGWVYYKLAQYEEAKTWIEKSIKFGKASAVVHEHLGDIYIKLGNRDKAREAWEQALDMNKQNNESSVSLQEKIKSAK
jgi:tetratricopeptide (TPR) repeat protein